MAVAPRRMAAALRSPRICSLRCSRASYSTAAAPAAASLSPSLEHPRTDLVVRASRLFRPTFGANRVGRSGAASSGVPSVELLLRGGHVRQSSAGVFTLLPPGLRILRKVSDVVRDEMTNPMGLAASEMAMPVLLPSALWRSSGRWDTMQQELLTLTARSGAEYLLGPTHEEEVTRLVAQDVPSYRHLPVRVFQITPKFRNELRPRAGLLRTREFLMKDLYTFDADPQAARVAYQQVRDAYARILDRLLGQRHGKWLSAVADTGAIGGELSHEYHFPDPLGEDTLLSCSSCHGLWNQELAPAAPRTGAQLPCEAADVQVALYAPPEAFRTDQRASPLPGAEEDGRTPESTSKLHAFVVPKDRTVNEAAVVRAGKGVALQPVTLGSPEIGPGALNSFFNRVVIHVDRECTLMDPTEMMEAVSTAVLVAVDQMAALAHAEGQVDPLAPSLYDLFPPLTYVENGELATHTSIESQMGTYSQAEVGDACGHCSRQGVTSPLEATKSIEVAHAFLLGTRYSDSLNVGFDPAPNTPAAEIAAKRDVEQQALEAQGAKTVDEVAALEADVLGLPSHRHMGQAPFQMGCYGVGISRLIGALAQRASARGEDKSLVWPRSIAPYVAYVIAPPLEDADEDTRKATERVLHLLTSSSPQAAKARAEVQKALDGVRTEKAAEEAAFLSAPLVLDDVLLDDRTASVPKRLIDAELMGSPIVLVLGRAWAAKRQVEVIIRDAVPSDEAARTGSSANARLLPSKRVTAFVQLDEDALAAVSAEAS